MRVLFAVDGSSNSFDAARQVGVLLSPSDQVALFCSPPAAPRATAKSNPEVVARARQDIVDAIFTEARKQLPAPLEASAEVLTGTDDARRGIVTAAEEWGAELIVMGARGLGAIERLLLGSVSRAVVHASKVPVWVGRAAEKRAAHASWRVLLASENPEQAAPLARALSQFTWPAGSSCRALAIVPSLFAGHVPEWLEKQSRSPDIDEMVQAWDREHKAEISSMQQGMDGFLKQMPPGLADCRALVVEGEPSSAILSAIKQQEIDLTIVGARHKNWLRTTLLGSTSEAVLNNALSSVLVVPQQD